MHGFVQHKVRLEATGLLKAVTEPGMKFVATMVHGILSLLDPPNKLLEAKATDLHWHPQCVGVHREAEV
jgi:hypothetical protein